MTAIFCDAQTPESVAPGAEGSQVYPGAEMGNFMLRCLGLILITAALAFSQASTITPVLPCRMMASTLT